MMLARRRLLQLGLAASASAVGAAPVEAFANSRHHGSSHRSAGHAAAGHGGAHHRDHHYAHQARYGHHHGRNDEGGHRVQQAALPLGDDPRRLHLHNLHTDEKLDAVFWENGRYVPDALNAVDHVLRDFRTGDVHPMDPAVLDLLSSLSARVETKSPFYIISGYRSPRTNALLRAEGGAETGVAKKSLHLQGQAIDLRLGDVALNHLHNAALSLGRGGVGYYPSSNFVHVDVGPVRQWGGV